MTKKRCYTVTFTIHVMVVADNEKQAQSLAKYHVGDEARNAGALGVVTIADGPAPSWDESCLVYQYLPFADEMTVAEALELNKEGI